MPGVLISVTACLLFSVRRRKLARQDIFGIHFSVNVKQIHHANIREIAAMVTTGINSFAFVCRKIRRVNLLNATMKTRTLTQHRVRAFVSCRRVTVLHTLILTVISANVDDILAIPCGLAKVLLTGSRVNAFAKGRIVLKTTVLIPKRVNAFALNSHVRMVSPSISFYASVLKMRNHRVHQSLFTILIFVDAFAVKRKNVSTVSFSTMHCANVFVHDQKFANQIKFGTKKIAAASATLKSCATQDFNSMSSNVIAFVHSK